MNHYEERQEARRERLEARAAKKRAEADARHSQFRKGLDMIPMGQPILVGHHSERGHRAHLRRIDNDMRKSIQASKEAARLESRAAAVGSGGISSDDPDAVKKLRAELQHLEHRQQRMKEANKAIRKHKKAGEDKQVEALHGLGYSEAKARVMIEPDFCGRVGFPSYVLSNNNANIRRIKGRIDQLEAAAARRDQEPAAEQHGDIELVRNHELNRIQLKFPGKPPAESRSILKRNGFRWAPSQGAWQRQLNNAGEWAAKEAIKRIGGAA